MEQNRRRKTKRKVSRRKRQRRLVLLSLGLLCLLLVFGIVFFVFHRYVSQYPEDRICKNISIGPVDVSNMKKKEAMEAMEQHLQTSAALTVTMKAGEQETAAVLEELGLRYEKMEETVEKALSYGKKGTVWGRYWKLRKLAKEKLVFDEKLVLDEKKTKAVLTERAVPLTDHAKDAVITRTGSSFSIEPEKEGKTIDIKKSMAKLKKLLNEKWNHKEFTIKLVQKKEMPSVKAEELQTIQDELGKFTTDAGGGERWKNLKTAAGLLNGTVLMPGEELSVHDKTAPYDEEHGYVPAGSYENGQVVDTYGGGICQVSTTLYNAVLYAELEVVKRYPHSMLITYVEPSRDAAIAGDYKDFVFKNSYDTPIYIEGGIDSANQLTFTIYGKDTREEGRTVEYESETTATEDYGTAYKANGESALGEVTYSGSPHTGKTARLWKVVSQNGKEISRDVINNSTYQKSDQVVEIGTKSDNAQAAAIIKEAIATQDKAKVKEAISRAKALQAPAQPAGEQSGQQDTQ